MHYRLGTVSLSYRTESNILSRGSLVNIKTWLLRGEPKYYHSIRGMSEIFFPSSGAHPAFQFLGAGSGVGAKLASAFHLVPRTRRVIASRPHKTSWRAQEKNLHLFYLTSSFQNLVHHKIEHHFRQSNHKENFNLMVGPV